VNKDWVDERLMMLEHRFRHFDFASSDRHQFLLEPTELIYGKLESGDESDLQSVVTSMARHIGITSIPTARYDWGLMMEPEVAGQIKNAIYLPYIQIPFFYVGKKYALGSILAHEVTHSFLYSGGVSLEDPKENELLTDLTAVFVGLGKLMLNGYSDERGGLGYLSADLIAYSLRKCCSLCAIDMATTTQNLTNEARVLVKRF
jgi:hypothetical protein